MDFGSGGGGGSDLISWQGANAPKQVDLDDVKSALNRLYDQVANCESVQLPF